MSDNFVIPKDFSKVLLVLAGMNLQCFYFGSQVSKMRSKIFNQ